MHVINSLRQCVLVLYLLALSFSHSLMEYEPLYNFPKSKVLQVLNLKVSEKEKHLKEPPQYMLDLYNEIADIDGASKRPLPYNASLARAIQEQDYSSTNDFIFSLNGVPHDEIVKEAVFHIYHRQLSKFQRKLHYPCILYKMNLYSNSINGSHLLSSHEVTCHSFGWRRFSVGNVVREATKNNIKFVQYSLGAETMDGQPLKLEYYHESSPAKAPLLVLFNNFPKNSTKHSLNSSALHKSVSVQKRAKRSLEIDATPYDSVSTDGCELFHMKVNFEDIGWSSWIVYPTQYNAHQCVGKCSFPLGQDYNPTNHATVQSLLHYTKKMSNVEHPSCVPTSYTSLALLYYDKDENVVIKQFEQMIATGCGCR